jgi:hypothetical protein
MQLFFSLLLQILETSGDSRYGTFHRFTVQDSVLLGKDFAVAINYGRFWRMQVITCSKEWVLNGLQSTCPSAEVLLHFQKQ